MVVTTLVKPLVKEIVVCQCCAEEGGPEPAPFVDFFDEFYSVDGPWDNFYDNFYVTSGTRPEGP